MAIDPKTWLPIKPVINAASAGPEAPIAPLPTPAGAVPLLTETPKPAQVSTPNPITGGVETINPTVGVNAGTYSPEQKAKAVTDMGYTLKPGMENVGYESIQNAFSRNEDGSIGVKEDMLSPYFEKKAAQPAVTTPPATVTPTAPVEPMATTEQTNKKQLDAIFAENAMTPEQKDWWMKNVFNTPEETNKFFALDDNERKKYMASIDFAQKTTRDATLKADYEKTQYDRQVGDAKAKFAVQLAQQKANMDADANNMGVAQGVSGRIQSQNMANAVKDQLDLNRQVYDQLKGSQDSYIQALADEHEYNMTRDSNEYNDNMSKVKQDLLQKIEGLQATGVMNTKSGLLQARKFVDAATSSANLAMQNYSYKLTVGAERVKAIADQMKEQNKYSNDMTEQMNDGYMYTAQGTRMTDSKGAALKKPESVSGVAMFKEPQKADDGTYFQAYQQADGSIKTVKLSGIWGATTPADEAVSAYARLLADKTISIDSLKGFSQSARDAIITAAGAYVANKPKEIKSSDFLKMEDADGNTYYFNPLTKESISAQAFQAATGTSGTRWSAGGNLDFTGMADKHPGEASFKNNNPAGITWHAASGALKKAWEDAGVKFEMGTPRPSKEGGNYVKFATVIDGINAREIAMERKGGSVRSSLMQWVGTTNQANNAAYADSIIKSAGIDGNKTYSQLTDGDKEALSIAQLRREAGGMYQEMISRGYITDEGFDYEKMSADSQVPEAQEPAGNQYTGIAKQLIDGSVLPSQLENLGYNKSQRRQIEAERMRLTSQNTVKSLSTTAQRAAAAKTISETGKEKTKVLNELQEAGVFDLGEGNQNYYEAKPDVKAELPQFFTARDSFYKAKAIADKHKAAGDLDNFLGFYDATQQRTKGKTGAFIDASYQKDFDALDNLLGKELSQYMKNISGAAVSEKEAERLQRQIPNLDMSETQFEQAMEIYEQSLKNASRYLVNQYGFADDDTARKVVLGETAEIQPTEPTETTEKKTWRDYETTGPWSLNN